MGMAQTTAYSFAFEGQSRSYRVHLPPGYTGTTPVPVVFNLHGYTSNALQQEFYSGMNAVADTAGFIVCYADGINNAWNSGFTLPYYGGVNDVGFLSVLIDTLQARYHVDPTRVYSCGMSNGGFMSYRLACDLDSRIAAIASVTGSMTTLQATKCACDRPMPILEIHGTQDGVVPYTTTALSLGIDSVLRYWRGENACTAATLHDTLPDLNSSDASTVTTQWYLGCDSAVEVAHYKVEGGGHTWPGSSFPIPGEVTNQDINASVEIWKFFSRFSHPHPVLTSAGTVVHLSRPPILHPNPILLDGSASLNVSLLSPPAHLHLLDVQGRSLGTWEADTADFRIPMDGLSPGMYFLRITHAGTPFCGKVVARR